MATQTAPTDGTISDALIERAHQQQMLRAHLDSRRAALVVAAGYSIPLKRVDRVVHSPLGPRDIAQPGRW